MSVIRRSVLIAAVGIAVVSGKGLAQGGVELGMDAGLRLDLSDPSVTTFEVPIQSVRAGFLVTERISAEPAVGLSYFKFEGEDAVIALNADLAALVHFGADGVRRGLYLRPVVGISFVDVGSESVSQFSAGAGVGVKLPLADQLAARVEASYRHGFENDDLLGTDVIGLSFGLSFFTR